MFLSLSAKQCSPLSRVFWLQCPPDLSITAFYVTFLQVKNNLLGNASPQILEFLLLARGPVLQKEAGGASWTSITGTTKGTFCRRSLFAMHRPSLLRVGKKKRRSRVFSNLHRCRAMQCNFFSPHIKTFPSPSPVPAWGARAQ